MSDETTTLPLKRALGVKRSTNLYLTAVRTSAAAKVADKRYGLSLSELVDEFLGREVDARYGFLRRKFNHGAPHRPGNKPGIRRVKKTA